MVCQSAVKCGQRNGDVGAEFIVNDDHSSMVLTLFKNPGNRPNHPTLELSDVPVDGPVWCAAAAASQQTTLQYIGENWMV